MSDMERPVGKEYAGPSGVGRDSTWLTAEDLIEGRDAEVKIEKVVLYPKVKFQGGRVRENMIGLQFEGKQRVLGLNATNRKSLNKMFGNITKAWKGNTITLYVAETQMAGETVKCVRIRNNKSRPATAAETFLEDDHDEPRATTLADVQQAIADAGLDTDGALKAASDALMRDVETLFDLADDELPRVLAAVRQ